MLGILWCCSKEKNGSTPNLKLPRTKSPTFRPPSISLSRSEYASTPQSMTQTPPEANMSLPVTSYECPLCFRRNGTFSELLVSGDEAQNSRANLRLSPTQKSA